MQYVKLGAKGPKISNIGFGAWGISGRDWGNTDDAISRRALHTALDMGLNFIDTADTYGFGHSEKLIADVLKERTDRERIVIATKAGNNFYPFLGKSHETTPGNPDYSVEHLVFAAEQSLKRLGTDRLDILQLHSPDTSILARDEPWQALEKLKKQGKIIHAGWSVQSFRESEQARFLEQHHELLDVIQLRYNLLEREAEKILLPLALKYGTGVIVRIPILFGLLTGKFSLQSRFGKDDHRHFNLSENKLSQYFDRLAEIREEFRQYPGYSMAQVSLRFCISHPACHVVIPGMKTPEQVSENLGASEMPPVII